MFFKVKLHLTLFKILLKCVEKQSHLSVSLNRLSGLFISSRVSFFFLHVLSFEYNIAGCSAGPVQVHIQYG